MRTTYNTDWPEPNFTCALGTPRNLTSSYHWSWQPLTTGFATDGTYQYATAYSGEAETEESWEIRRHSWDSLYLVEIATLKN